MRSHAAAELFPMLEPLQLAELAEDIKVNGQKVPIVVHAGLILDGRNRARACEIAGRTPITVPWDGVGSPTSYVISVNLKRRHLDESQRAMVGARAKGMFEEEAHERQRAGGREKGSANLREASAKSAAQAAALVNVSPRSVESASKVLAKGAPELRAEVDAGRIAVSQAARIADRPAEEQRKVVDRVKGGLSAVEAQRLIKAETIARAEMAKPSGKYRVIYADPPWSYGNRMPPGTTEPRDHYPTMALRDICALPVAAMVADDAVLFLWVTSPLLPESLEVISAWGFTYKSSFVWDKVKHNMGHYNSVRHEFLFVCTRGACQPDVRKLFDSVVTEERTEHSKKPTQFYDIIDTLYPHGKRIELFARARREGWDVWGYEAPGSAA